ncbi:MAG: hypothetical protein RIF33_09330 [Cyclobacteriaceae bacterium]
MKKLARFYFTSLLLLVFGFQAAGQEGAGLVMTDFAKWYDSQIGVAHNGLYSGTIYIMLSPSRTTHQFYLTNRWKEGSLVLVNGQIYNDVPMVLDIEKQLLVVQHPRFGQRDGIQLDIGSVVSFNLDGHFFRKIELNDNEGFYEVLLDGKHFSLMAQRMKSLEAEGGSSIFKENTDYFLLKDGFAAPLKNRKSLEILTLQSKVVAKQIQKQHKMRLNKSKEDKLINYLRLFDEEMEN